MADFQPRLAPPKHRGKQPVKDHVVLARLLAMMGQSRIGNNLNQLAKAVNSGSLPVKPETEAELLEAARAIVHMCRLLLEALQIEATP